jgi:hypothetical protein
MLTRISNEWDRRVWTEFVWRAAENTTFFVASKFHFLLAPEM